MSPPGWTKLLDLQTQMHREGIWRAGGALYWKLNPKTMVCGGEDWGCVEDRVARHVMEQARALTVERALTLADVVEYDGGAGGGS